MMKTYFEHVAEFHHKLQLPVSHAVGGPRYCGLMGPLEQMYRVEFLKEELLEFTQAWDQKDLAGCADALVDLVWVVLGTAHYMGLPFDQLWAEVYRANMEKRLRQEGDPIHKRGAVETIVKPEGWHPPDIEGVLKSWLNRKPTP